MSEYLKCTEEQRNEIIKRVNLTPEKLQSGVEAVLEWYKKQQHLPRIDLDSRMVQCILISRKGSVEQTKGIIDMHFSLRNLLPEFAMNRDIFDTAFENAHKGCLNLPMPKLNKDLTRIYIFKYTKDTDFFNVIDTLNYCFTVYDYRLTKDCFAGDTFMLDIKDLSMNHFIKLAPKWITNMEVFLRKSYGLRLFGFHLIGGTKLLNNFVTLLKSTISEKLAKRVYMHENLESLYKYIDKGVLPSDYGGNEAPLIDLLNNLKVELGKDENRKELMNQVKLRSNEALRIGDKLNYESLGIPGTFSKIEVD